MIEHIIKEDGIYRRIVEERLLEDSGRIISGIVDKKNTFVSWLDSNPKFNTSTALMIHKTSGETLLISFLEHFSFPKIKIHGNNLIPDLGGSTSREGDVSFNRRTLFKFPRFILPIFVTRHSKLEVFNPSIRGHLNLALLVSSGREIELKHPGLSNVFDNGNLCPGRIDDYNTHRSILSAHYKALNIFYQNPWGSDLPQPHYQELYVWKKDFTEHPHLQTPDIWLPRLRSIGNDQLACVAIAMGELKKNNTGQILPERIQQFLGHD